MEVTLENSEKIAAKMTPIFDLIGSLSTEEIEYIKQTAKAIEEEISTRQAVAGILVPLDKAELMNALGEQAMERITGIVLIWAAIKSQPELVREYHRKARNSREIEQMFGL